MFVTDSNKVESTVQEYFFSFFENIILFHAKSMKSTSKVSVWADQQFLGLQSELERA